MPLPAGGHVAPDRLAREPVPERVFRVVLAAPEQRVALQASDDPTGSGEELSLTVDGIGRRPPPRRFDRPSAVRRDDEVDADLVEALPDLPPRGRAAVAEVEIGRRGHRQDLWRAGHRLSMAEGSACTARD